MPALFVALAGLCPERLGRAQCALAQYAQYVVAEIIEQGCRVREEQRQVVLDPGRGTALLQVLVQRTAARIDVEALAQQVAEGARCGVIQRELARRKQAHGVDLVQGTLRFRIEAADRIDLLVQEFDPVRLGRAHRIHVEQRAAHREIARVEHLRHVAVAGGFESALFGVQIESLSRFHHQGLARNETRRGKALHQGRDRHHQQAAARRGQAIQRGHALRHDVRMRAEQVVGQGFPIREVQHRHFIGGAAQDPQLGFQGVRGVGIARHRHHQPAMHARCTRHGEGEGAAAGWCAPVGAPVAAARQCRMQQRGIRVGGAHRVAEFSSAVRVDGTCCHYRNRSRLTRTSPGSSCSSSRRKPSACARASIGRFSSSTSP